MHAHARGHCVIGRACIPLCELMCAHTDKVEGVWSLMGAGNHECGSVQLRLRLRDCLLPDVL